MVSLGKQFQSKLRFVQMSAQKIRPFADLIRGRFADEALELLSCYPNRGARFVEAVVRSAIASARDKNVSKISELEIAEIRVDGGPVAKRFRPKSRGASSVYLKRSSHITVVLE